MPILSYVMSLLHQNREQAQHQALACHSSVRHPGQLQLLLVRRLHVANHLGLRICVFEPRTRTKHEGGETDQKRLHRPQWVPRFRMVIAHRKTKTAVGLKPPVGRHHEYRRRGKRVVLWEFQHAMVYPSRERTTQIKKKEVPLM